MPATNVHAVWNGGNLEFRDSSGTAVFTLSQYGVQDGQVAVTATADGTGTGTIPDGARSVAVTSANVAHIVVLPTPTPGTVVVLHVGANGYELRSDTPASVAINGGSGASAESAIPANSTVIAYCASATAWRAFQIASDGTTAGVEAAA